ncbi:preprotein translocase subunit SecG [Pseudomonas mangrovi]|uniref:Protein-export membrane protein SecG n=1 Tax=Pseudomonas mangrovi TaxID=2161748 RepID=A0A2T5P8B2_9PSED|nr:preprotein translocase subunit SecG [Pseudomonas mangrovi]PTU73947.1 preprotein translocase subunit SecG [Pseudomonas mangrovi]
MLELESVVIVLHLLGAIGIVAFVLLQQGKGAEAGASFGGGASGTVFGSQGSTTFFSRATAILATAFFLTSLGLAYVAKQKAQGWDDLGLPTPAVQEVQREQVLDDDVPVLEERQPEAPAEDVPELQE